MERTKHLTIYLLVGGIEMGEMALNMKRDTRGEIMQVARELVQSRGFNAFSYKDLSDRLGIRKASIHYHFPSKEDLGVALLEAFAERMHQWKMSPRILDASPAEKLDYLFETYLEIASDGDKICATGIFSSEWNTLTERLREKLQELMTAQRSWLVGLIREGREAGVFLEGTDPVDLARLIFAGIQGGIQLARVQGDPSLFASVAAQLKTMVLAPVPTS